MSEFTFIKIATLTQMLNDKSRSNQEHERVAEILSLVAERLKFPVEHPREGATQEEIEREVQVHKMLLEGGDISLMWYQPEDVMFKTLTENGGTYRVVVSKKYHGSQASEPAPIPAKLNPAPQREPIVGTTVPPEEKKYLTLDERFAPAEVSRRVQRINDEAAELRRQREEENERRGFSL